MISETQAVELVKNALGIRPCAMHRQTLTHSGNCVFQAILPDQRSVVIRISPRPKTFAFTERNLLALRQLGLPVQTVLASGLIANGGSFIILNWLSGRDLMYELPAMRPEQMSRVARTIVDYQKRISTLPMSSGFGWAPIGKNAASASWAEIFGVPATEPVPDNAPPLEQLRGKLRALRQSVEPYLATIRPTCFLDDLTTKNILIGNGEITGVIDVDFVCFGDPLMSVGTTLALLAVDVGHAGRFYGEELIRSWSPSPDQQRAIQFYAALWVVGMLNAAEAAGETARVNKLMPVACELLQTDDEGTHVSKAA